MDVWTYIKVILLFGAAFAVLTSSYLLFYPHKSFSNRVLGVLMFLWSITVISFGLQSDTFFLRFPHFYGVGSLAVFLFFPLIYMYVKSYIHENARTLKQYLVHFIPFLIWFGMVLPFYIKSAEEKVDMLTNGFPEWLRITFNSANIVIIVQGILYTILSINLLQRFQYFSERKLTRNQLNSVKWLWQFVIINVILWAIGTTGAFLEIMKIAIPFDPFVIFYLGVTIITLRMGYFSVKYPTFFILQESKPKQLIVPGIKKQEKAKNQNELKLILDFFEERKPYLNKEFNLQNLADSMGIPRHRISELINNELEKSFSDFVNEYRVNEVIRLIEEGKHIENTLIYIGEQAGFNSKANFFRIFKKVTGMTPNEFIKTR